MAGDKISVTFEVNPDTLQMAEKITDKYELPDRSKTLRCLLDFVSEKESSWDAIFKKIRCNHC
jgi:predicted O-methyltransferase YrrM